ncbi:uncharacterized protein LOC143081063 [Mytilus galloprovincialis]|uniref:uncharacterized protein LOC143081063 n=1 Tax=Mytilus galloprovincialis TaxID=29158 RepID=UPI003F7B49D9
MAFPCVVCLQHVRPRQHALQCEGCSKWQHRLCNTGVSQLEYRRMVNAEIDVIFRCIECMPAEPDVAPEPEPEPEAEPEAAPEPEAVIPDQSFNISLAIEEVEEIVESDIEDPELPDNVVGNLPVTYHIEEQGSKRRFKKLVSSDGFAYTVKRSSTTVTHWRCSVRSKSLWCKATVAQRGGMFIPGVIQHVHPCDPGLTKKTVVRAKALKAAEEQPYVSAGDIVDTAMEVVSDDDFNLPNPGYVERSVNRLREKLRPEEPKDLTFEINTAYLKCDGFVVGDITVRDKRHIMFATQEQLQLLQTAKKWYLDGTFKVVKKPFYQLFSIHAFIQKDNCMKQIPLLFVLMSRREKKDYKAVFTRLVELIPQHRVQAFCLDFEAGAWSAVKSVFPNADIKGCAFHWGQAVMRKVANLGLKTAYSADKAVNVFIKKVLALPYLPAGHIIPAYRQLTVPPTI